MKQKRILSLVFSIIGAFLVLLALGKLLTLPREKKAKNSSTGISHFPEGLSSSTQGYAEINGAVQSPGVYQLSNDERVISLLDQAGGLSPLADKDYVVEHIHLAQKVLDQDKIVIPFIFSQSTSSEESININIASRNELEKLGITDNTLLDTLVTSRPFSSLTDFKKKVKLPQDVLKKISSKLRFS